MTISYKQLLKDTRDLWEEYKKEDKKIYKQLYNSLFDNKEEKTLKSRPLTTKNNQIDFWIVVERYPNPVETYFFRI